MFEWNRVDRRLYTSPSARKTTCLNRICFWNGFEAAMLRVLYVLEVSGRRLVSKMHERLSSGLMVSREGHSRLNSTIYRTMVRGTGSKKENKKEKKERERERGVGERGTPFHARMRDEIGTHICTLCGKTERRGQTASGFSDTEVNSAFPRTRRNERETKREGERERDKGIDTKGGKERTIVTRATNSGRRRAEENAFGVVSRTWPAFRLPRSPPPPPLPSTLPPSLRRSRGFRFLRPYLSPS